jgi:predicted amidohydrolase
MHRRTFVGGIAAWAACGATRSRPSLAAEAPAPPRPQRVTLAQVTTHQDIPKNLANARRALEQAREDKADFVLFPEMFLTGYYGQLRQDEAAQAMASVAELCRTCQVTALVGTGWKEDGKVYNQVRITDAAGDLAGVYAKKCVCYGEDQWTTPGTTPLVFTVRGLKLGILICNDLWVTPGFSDGPNPHLSLKQARAGAQVIFHHINSGSDQRYRGYHESNHFARAAEAKCPIVAINAFQAPEVNATSGVVGTGFKHIAALPRDREVIQTVEFLPAVRPSK